MKQQHWCSDVHQILRGDHLATGIKKTEQIGSGRLQLFVSPAHGTSSVHSHVHLAAGPADGPCTSVEGL